MPIRSLFIVAAGLLCCAGSARAQTADCAKAQTQIDLDACAAASLKAADAALNAAYGKVEARLAGQADALKLLTAAQRDWIAFRDAECAFASSSVSGGSIYPMVLLACKERLTRARTKDFQAYLACKEGDVSCPLPPQ